MNQQLLNIIQYIHDFDYFASFMKIKLQMISMIMNILDDTETYFPHNFI
jgi:hypothetical protein